MIKEERKKEGIWSIEAIRAITGENPWLQKGFNEPFHPKGRNDICVIRRQIDGKNGNGGCDFIYLVWKEEDGSLKYKKIADGWKEKKGNINRHGLLYLKSCIEPLIMNEDGSITVFFDNGEAYKGAPWNE